MLGASIYHNNIISLIILNARNRHNDSIKLGYAENPYPGTYKYCQ